MSSPIEGATLDHVAVAVEAWSDAWPCYAVALGGAWSSGGLNVGFGPAQLRFSNGGRVEILQPWRPEDNSFLRRFLDRHGPGPHHLTFKVPDLASAIDKARAAGFSPVGVDLTNADWKEAFLHPRQATGIVVQLAQAAYGWESPPPEGFPTNRRDPAASLERVTHAVADIDDGLAIFEGLLGGRRTARGTAPDRTWEFADLQWPGPPRLRLISPVSDADGQRARADTPLGAWLGQLPGRVHHLAFSVPGSHATDDFADHPDVVRPGQVPGLGSEDALARVIEPQDNLGTRLVVLEGPPESDT
jgi:catechol 2,3-dioxygenase-like lactoylglutathione lyase family enzyme